MKPSDASSRSNARRTQRIELAQPLPAQFGEVPVTLIELSEDGAAMTHHDPLPIHSTATMRVEARQPFEVQAAVRYSVVTATGGSSAPAYRSGVAFRRIPEDTAAVIENILIDQAMSLVRLWEANAAGLTSSPAIAAMQQRSAMRAPSAYIWMRLMNGQWERITTRDPNQPVDGFAVPASEDPKQIVLLCETYEKASLAERQFIRAMAQRAIAEMRAARSEQSAEHS